MSPFISRQEQFTCEHCHKNVAPLEDGKIRNHCPRCLWCKHVDDLGPGDRASLCQGLMAPVDLTYSGAKGWQLIHECVRCHKRIANITAHDDDLEAVSDINEE